MGLIRGGLSILSYGAVSPKSKKQRMASMQLAAMQGMSPEEVKIAGRRNFTFANDQAIQARRMKQQRQAGQQQSWDAGEQSWNAVPTHVVDYYPVMIPGDRKLHLIYGDLPGIPALCGRSGTRDVHETLSIDDVTCRSCRASAGDFGGPPKSPFILTGSCPRCSRPVTWYRLRDKHPVHAATGKFECPPDDSSEEDPGTGITAEPDTGITAELERLAALHTSGALDDEEFRAAKRHLLGG